MKRSLTIAVTLVFVGLAPAAFAQSGQGGYLGLNPGKQAVTSAARAMPMAGSGQGGYLGKTPGAGLQPATALPAHGSGQGGYLGLNPAG